VVTSLLSLPLLLFLLLGLCKVIVCHSCDESAIESHDAKHRLTPVL
jgi:hypothetical protein